MRQEQFDRIRLARSQRVGPVVYRQLLRRFGGAGDAIRALSVGGAVANKASARGIIIADERVIEQEIERTFQLGGNYLVQGDDGYPALLGEAGDAPLVLIYRGDLAMARARTVAMVGARNASAAACRFARTVSRDLSAQGVVVVSGLARGIDTAAHLGALSGMTDDDGSGGTIAVIASGIDIAYPHENASLQEHVASHGLLLTEHPPGTEPKARHFPNRNRIIAGLCTATLVVEAAPQSGSLITARMAGDYGRDVLAVPGSPLDPRARGCNELIRNGATLIQSADDVIEALTSFTGGARYHAGPAQQGGFAFDAPADVSERPLSPAGPPPVITANNDATLLSALGSVPISVDELIRQTGLTATEIQMLLLDLEMQGRIERHSGGKIALKL